MAYSSIVPFLLMLWAPPPEPGTAPVAASEAAEPEDAAEPEGEGAPEDAPPDEAAPPSGGSEAASEATEPPSVRDPFDAPAPTVVAPTPPPPTPIPPPPARPIRWRLDIAPGIGATIVKDLGFRALSWNRSLLDVDVSTIFDFRLAESRFFVGGGLAYAFARRSGYAYDGALIPWLELHEPRVLGRAGFMVVEGVDVFARVGVGPSIVRLDFDSSYGDWEDYENPSYGYHRGEQGLAVLPRLDGQAGLSLYLPKRWLPRKQASRVTAGLELGLGYVWRGKLAARPTLERGDDTIRVTPANWGELSLHGLAWSARLFVRVM